MAKWGGGESWDVVELSIEWMGYTNVIVDLRRIEGWYVQMYVTA